MVRFFIGAATAGGVLLGLAAAEFPGPGMTEVRPACGAAYEIRRGDSLYEIAERVYRDGREFERIFEANRDRLTSPASIREGDTILIPCLVPAASGVRQDAREAALAAAIAERLAEPTGSIGDPSSAAPPAAPAPIRLVTVSGFAPYSDQYPERGGMIADLVTRALARADSMPEFRLAFVNDRAAHLDSLLPGRRFDISFPWFKPDCAAAATLDPEQRRLCADYQFSDPFHEVTIAVYARAGDPLTAASGAGDLAGRTLCQTRGNPPLALPTAAVVSAPDIAECLGLLARGEVDAVAGVKPETDRWIPALGLTGAIREVEALESTRTLHAVALKANPDAAAQMATLDQGLESLKISGEWFDVVAAHNARDPGR
jgi:polar amino acid transport system substrate-binding protein